MKSDEIDGVASKLLEDPIVVGCQQHEWKWEDHDFDVKLNKESLARVDSGGLAQMLIIISWISDWKQSSELSNSRLMHSLIFISLSVASII